jgi:hypothetical protein
LTDLPERFLLVWKLSHVIELQKRAYRKGYNIEKDKSKPDKHVLDDFFITQADFFVLNLAFGLLGQKHDVNTTDGIKEVIQILDTNHAEAMAVYRSAVSLIRDAYLKDKVRAGSYVNSFFKNPKNLVLLREHAKLE